MRTFSCNCGNTLFFESTVCLECGADVGMCPVCQNVVPLVADESGNLHCGNPACGAGLFKCYNYQTQGNCNRCFRAEEGSEQTLCDYCRLTTVIPDLWIEGNREKWRRLIQAKLRVLYMVDKIGLPFRQAGASDGPQLTFEFKADGKRPVSTGHKNGCITINIREADDVEREKARVKFDEPQRTLVGHFRHELGHYFWDRLVAGQCEEEFRAAFGDERNPLYADALTRYHKEGPLSNWRESFISAYATMHPWEDFAETFGAYLDMVSVLDTARHFGMSSCELDDINLMLSSYQQVGVFGNELNRDIGLVDLVPEVFVPAVVGKLQWIHALVEDATASDCS